MNTELNWISNENAWKNTNNASKNTNIMYGKNYTDSTMLQKKRKWAEENPSLYHKWENKGIISHCEIP